MKLKRLSLMQTEVALAYNVPQLTDSFCFSQKFWLGAVSSLVFKLFEGRN
jgi:hypothetical protein